MKSISIIGCGWFGLPLAYELVKSGMQVIGTKRSTDSFPALIENDVTPIELDLSKLINQQPESNQKLSEDFNTDYLLINVPPRTRSGNSHYLEELVCLKRLLNIEKYQKVIFVSTTGVYPNLSKVMTEGDASSQNNGSELLYQAEQLFSQFSNTIILRFSGLIGPQRHPGRFFANRAEVAGGDAPVNLVHLNDCINAVKALLTSEHTSKIYNLSIPHHPSKAEFYSTAIKSMGRVAPSFLANAAVKKQIDGSLITKDIEFEYLYPDLYEAIKFC